MNNDNQFNNSDYKSGLPIKINLPNDFLKEETRCDFVVSEKRKAIWAIQIDLFKELERVCNKYNLKLFGFAGTVLGAVRHKGFIPWDDDMDFGMSRRDYEILCKHACEEFEYPYYWDDGYSNDLSSRGHGQLKNSLTTCILRDENNNLCNFNQGIFIDIFPYDNVADDDFQSEKFLLKMQRLNSRMMRYKYSYLNVDYSVGLKRVLKKIYIYFFQVLNASYDNKYFAKYQKNKAAFNNCITKKCAFLHFVKRGDPTFLVFDKQMFENLISTNYEFCSLFIPKAYEAYLTKAYGDWKILRKGTTVHGKVFFDPYKSYEYYLNHRDEIIYD